MTFLGGTMAMALLAVRLRCGGLLCSLSPLSDLRIAYGRARSAIGAQAGQWATADRLHWLPVTRMPNASCRERVSEGIRSILYLHVAFVCCPTRAAGEDLGAEIIGGSRNTGEARCCAVFWYRICSLVLRQEFVGQSSSAGMQPRGG